jgi:hypothetical protein
MSGLFYKIKSNKQIVCKPQTMTGSFFSSSVLPFKRLFEISSTHRDQANAIIESKLRKKFPAKRGSESDMSNCGGSLVDHLYLTQITPLNRTISASTWFLHWIQDQN